MEARLSELEAKLAFAEDLLEALNRRVYEQQRQLDELQDEVKALRKQLREQSPAAPGNPREDIPPHY